MKKYLVPAIIYGDFSAILKLVGNILIIGYFLVPHIGAQPSAAQLEYNQRMQEYRLDRLEKMFAEYTEKNALGWDKVGVICLVLSLIGGLSSLYVKGTIRISVLEFAQTVAKDIDGKFIRKEDHDSGMKRVLSELESLKESQRRYHNAKS